MVIYRIILRVLMYLAPSLVLIVEAPAASQTTGRLTVRVEDEETDRQIAARIHLKDQHGEPVKLPNLVWWNDHGVFDGETTLDLPAGTYDYQLEHGPEYTLKHGTMRIEPGTTRTVTVRLRRLVDMAAEGWWSGDLHIHRPLEQIKLHQQAEDLHVGPVITWWNNRNPWSSRPIPEPLLHSFDDNYFYHIMGGEDERGGGALMYFQLKQPLPVAGAQREYPSPVEYLKTARSNEGVHVDIEKPFWWDVPVWIATEMADTIGIANNHMCRDSVLGNEAWGRARDRDVFPGTHGNGLWTQYIYYQLLNCGLKTPPSAGSASGVLPNPVGYNRVYVHAGNTLDYDRWWDALRRGRSFVTNGPMLRVSINDQWPGHTFSFKSAQAAQLRPTVNLDSRDPIKAIQIIRDGQVFWSSGPQPAGSMWTELPSVTFDRSGWMLVRVLVDNEKTFRFASTAPFYVQMNGHPRISRSAAEFFVDWVGQRKSQINLQDADQQMQVLTHHDAAARFWRNVLSQANAN